MSTNQASVAFGAFLQAQRQLANISQRQLARVSGVSDSYLSQVERGKYRPSADVLKALAEAFGMPVSTMYAQSGLWDDEPEATPLPGVDTAIRRDDELNAEQKAALLSVYQAFLTSQRSTTQSA
jgi:transcriptional regulator with XRE-family HTH domain